MEKKVVRTKDYTCIKYRCDKCRNVYEGIVKQNSGTVRLKCGFCGNEVVFYL